MKFILATMALGVALLLGPIAHHAYYVSQFPRLLPAVLNSGTALFELPRIAYMACDITGMLLTLTAAVLGIRKLLADERARKANKPA
jgi:hypothetical protein